MYIFVVIGGFGNFIKFYGIGEGCFSVFIYNKVFLVFVLFSSVGIRKWGKDGILGKNFFRK